MANKQATLASTQPSAVTLPTKAPQVGVKPGGQDTPILLIFGCLSSLSFFGIAAAGLTTGHDFVGTVLLACCAFGGLSIAGMVTNAIYSSARQVADKQKLAELAARQAEIKQHEAEKKSASSAAHSSLNIGNPDNQRISQDSAA